MSPFALALVLAAAALHAIWNAMVKASGDRLVTLGGIAGGHVVLGVVLVATSPMPSPESWACIAASTAIHWAYYALLFIAYRLGDLSQVYPISRGAAPMLVAIGAQVFADEHLAPLAWGGIVAVSLGIGLLSTGARGNRAAVGAALATGVVIAAYSVVDGIGVRLSGAPLGYVGWLFVCELPVVAFVLWRRGLARRYQAGLAGGVISATAYGLALYAKTIAPIGAVSAVRESSTIIAALIGVIWLRERPWRLRVAAAAVVAFGVTLLAAS